METYNILLGLALLGVDVHLQSNYYDILKGFGKQQARALIRPFTAHNSKLGLNFDVAA